MRTLAFAALFVGVSTTALAQGTVYFSNRATPGVDAPVYFPGGATGAMISQLTVELLAGTNPAALTPVATTGFVTGAPGYFDGGVVSTLLPVTTNAFFQINFRTTATFLTNPHDKNVWFLWGHSPVFSGSLGDTNSPGLLSGLATGPLVLAVPRLSIRPTQTNTLVLSLEVPPTNGYGLSAVYALEQSSGVNGTNWTAVPSGYASDAPAANNGTIIPPTQGTMFYRLAIK
jgi:hypothetical protein